jgi:PhzF family phenazine biosynthesis protein
LKLHLRLAESNINVKADFPIVSVVKGMTFVLVELESEEVLKLIGTTNSPLFVSGLDEDWNETFVGMYFFVRSKDRPDGTKVLRTRMIEGTLEDPATGSAASDLAGYLSIIEGKPEESLRYEIIQGVEMGRRSEISIEVVMKKDTGIADIYLEGSSVQVMKGSLTI